MHHETYPVLAFAAAYALVLVTPGPNLLIVLRASITPPRQKVVSATFGVALGAALAAALGLVSASMAIFDERVERIAAVLFAALLLWSSYRLIWPRRRSNPAAPPSSVGIIRTFAIALAAAASNPVTLSFFTSLFVAHPVLRLEAGTVLLTVFAMVASWFLLVGLFFATFTARILDGAAGMRYRILLAILLVCCAVLALWNTVGA